MIWGQWQRSRDLPYPALITYRIPMEKKKPCTRTSQNVYGCDNQLDPPTDQSLSFRLTHIHTKRDTHGFWVCRHPGPPLHSPGQYPQPGWSSLNSPVFTHKTRQGGGYNNVPHLISLSMLFRPLTLRSSSSCCFSLSFWKSPRAFAFSLSLENSLQEMEPETEGDSGESGDRAVERKNRENKSENLDKANHVTMLLEDAEGRKEVGTARRENLLKGEKQS